jgi:hypothetical protein
MDQVQKDTLGLDCTVAHLAIQTGTNVSLKSSKGRSIRSKLFKYFGSNPTLPLLHWIFHLLCLVIVVPSEEGSSNQLALEILRAPKKKKLHSSD